MSADLSQLPYAERRSAYVKALETQSINALTLRELVDTILDGIFDISMDDELRIRLGKKIFEDLWMYYKTKRNEKEQAVKDLRDPIKHIEDYNLKCAYLNFRDEDALLVLLETFYKDRFISVEKDGPLFELQMENDVRLTDRVFAKWKYVKELLDHFLKWIDVSPTYEQKSNLLDVLLRYFPGDERVKDVYAKLRKSLSIFEDEQSVHSEGFTDAFAVGKQFVEDWGCVWKTASALPPVFKVFARSPTSKLTKIRPCDSDGCLFSTTLSPTNYVRRFLEQYIPQPTASALVKRMSIDSTRFPGDYGITDIFVAFSFYIESKDCEAWKTVMDIFEEEAEKMKGLCASGYATRIVSCLQGLDPRYEVLVKVSVYIHSVLAAKLAIEMDEVEDVLEDFKKYRIFVQSIVNEHIPEFLAVYGDSLENEIGNAVIPFFNGMKEVEVLICEPFEEKKKIKIREVVYVD